MFLLLLGNCCRDADHLFGRPQERRWVDLVSYCTSVARQWRVCLQGLGLGSCVSWLEETAWGQAAEMLPGERLWQSPAVAAGRFLPAAPEDSRRGCRNRSRCGCLPHQTNINISTVFTFCPCRLRDPDHVNIPHSIGHESLARKTPRQTFSIVVQLLGKRSLSPPSSIREQHANTTSGQT